MSLTALIRMAMVSLLASATAFANPTVMTVSTGSASAVTSGSTLTVTAANNTFLNWQSFNIASGETTVFQQPSSTAIAWNSIGGASASQIYGSLQANGVVVLMNPSGFYFGPDAFVKAAGFIAATGSGGPVITGSGTGWQFTGPPPAASIINYGKISADPGGFVYLLGASINNQGSITAPAGNIGLCAGQTVLLSERADGRGLSAQVTLPTGSVNNSGQLVADAGTILANAQVVNQNGLVEANSVQSVNGIIELDAAGSLTLGAKSRITANGDHSASGSSGGQILLQTAGAYSDTTGSQVQFNGGIGGGDGGRVLIDAASSDVKSTLTGTAQSGYAAGSKYFFPRSPSLSLDSGSLAPFAGFSSILFQTSGNLTLAAGTAWDLAAGTGSFLELMAGGNITFADGSSVTAIKAGDGWAVTLQAGRDFSTSQTVSGAGSILFSGASVLQTGDGNLSLQAGGDITVMGGAVRTVNGGSISAIALAGSVNTGNNPNGYDFHPAGFSGAGFVYGADPNLGGISTANGGNVSITAGLDIVSYLPVAGGVQTDAGSGCFGAAAGNLTLTAGRNVTGHYVVANGSGILTAGNNAGTTLQPLALSLIDGGWNVTAGNDILLQEVRNPNGVFNNFGRASAPTRNYFDYAANDFVVLSAGDGVTLSGSALPRYPDSFDTGIPCLYPPSLEITAGAGGVSLGNTVILFPSDQGGLNITTTGGGGLTSTKPGPDLAQLVLSDSGKTRYTLSGDFGLGDHAAIPVHINDNRSVNLNLSSDMIGIYLVSAESAQVNVGGNLINCRLDAQNLHSGDVTAINVAGSSQNRSEFTSVALSSAPDFNALAGAYPPLTGDVANLINLFNYDASSKTVTFQGRMTTDQYQSLLNLQVQKYDTYGQPVFDSSHNPVTVPAQFISASVLQSLFNASQNIPSDPDSGFRVGGGGTFEVRAASLDLGATGGIVSEGPAENAALVNYFTHGADIHVQLGGDLTMFSTAIAGLNGGNISVTAGGVLNLGSTFFSANDDVARGIFSTGGGSVSVTAGGDVNINGSRIATYDGGNVSVESQHGKVNVGVGGQGSAPVEEIYVNPVTRSVSAYTVTIPGCGILATTFPQSLDPAFPTSQNAVGDIAVMAPQGDILSTSAGIVQIPLNGSSASSGSVTLRAGTEAADGSVLYLGSIDVAGGGVIGANVSLKATGDIKGAVVARNHLDISALQNVSVAAFSGGDATVSAGERVSGTLIGMDGLNVSGVTIDAALLSQNINASGNVASSQVGFAPITVASSASQSEAPVAAAKGAAMLGNSECGDEPHRKAQGGNPQLASSGRVTVLPP